MAAVPVVKHRIYSILEEFSIKNRSNLLPASNLRQDVQSREDHLKYSCSCYIYTSNFYGAAAAQRSRVNLNDVII